MSQWADLFFFLRVPYSAYHLLISCFLLAGLMAHQPVFSELSPQGSLARGFAAELCQILTAFDVSQTMLKFAS